MTILTLLHHVFLFYLHGLNLMSIAIFVGPTFPFGQINEYLHIPATIFPPIKRGHIEMLAADHEVIVIIDGVFHSTLSVSAREILLALKEKTIYGCSSMGALRAAELDKFGMIGVGEVYKMYSDRRIVSDGEVALLFDPVTYENMTVPLVNVRFALTQAVKNEVINQTTRDYLLTIASKIHYTELDYLSVIKNANQDTNKTNYDALMEYLSLNIDNLDLKKKDALELIGKLNFSFKS